MKIIILGGAGFIGTNLTLRLSQNKENQITLVDKNISFFKTILSMNLQYVTVKESSTEVH